MQVNIHGAVIHLAVSLPLNFGIARFLDDSTAVRFICLIIRTGGFLWKCSDIIKCTVVTN